MCDRDRLTKEMRKALSAIRQALGRFEQQMRKVYQALQRVFVRAACCASQLFADDIIELSNFGYNGNLCI